MRYSISIKNDPATGQPYVGSANVIELSSSTDGPAMVIDGVSHHFQTVNLVGTKYNGVLTNYPTSFSIQKITFSPESGFSVRYFTKAQVDINQIVDTGPLPTVLDSSREVTDKLNNIEELVKLNLIVTAVGVLANLSTNTVSNAQQIQLLESILRRLYSDRSVL